MGGSSTTRFEVELARLCAGQGGHVELQAGVSELVGSAVPFDAAIQGTVDPSALLETGCLPIGIPADAERERAFMHLEYTSDDPLSYAELAGRRLPAAALRAEVDDLGTVRRYRELLSGFGVTDELRAAYVADGHCWGSVTLYRSADHPPFDAGEVALVGSISESMARALRGAFLRAAVDADGLEDPPGHCTLSRAGELLTSSAAAESWLESLEPFDRVPPVFAALLGRLEQEPEARATVVGTSGPLTVHASPAKGGADDLVAVVIEKPRPVHLAPLVVAAHGLTPRERDVAEAVLQGLTTRQVARRLDISDYTVQDHLKAVFAKVGVGTRGELAWALYARHYLPASESGATPGPYGWFLPS